MDVPSPAQRGEEPRRGRSPRESDRQRRTDRRRLHRQHRVARVQSSSTRWESSRWRAANAAAPFHPNARGEARIAAEVVSASVALEAPAHALAAIEATYVGRAQRSPAPKTVCCRPTPRGDVGQRLGERELMGPRSIAVYWRSPYSKSVGSETICAPCSRAAGSARGRPRRGRAPRP
jgi:hypothetical protein